MQITAAPQVHGVLDLDMCRKDEDRRLGKLLTDDACGVETLSGPRPAQQPAGPRDDGVARAAWAGDQDAARSLTRTADRDWTSGD
jgi:hypothetical protein